jgi:RNA-dependent RNA polymerase
VSFFVTYHQRTELLIRLFRDELAREQRSIIENKGQGLGLLGDFCGEAKWYGGRIQQIARMVKTSAGLYNLHLGAMQKVGRSHRLARFLGSRRVLQIKLPAKAIFDPKEMKTIKKFLSQKFVLCGRVFAAFAVKDEKIYLVETNEDYEREPSPADGDYLRLSLLDLVKWYNPLELNAKQASSAGDPVWSRLLKR